MRAAAGGGFIVVLRNQFRDGLGELVAESRPVRRRPEANFGIHRQGPKVRKYIRPGLDPELWFEDIVVLSHFVAGEREFEGASKDPDDDKYIVAAIEGRAGFVVAGDSDLLDLKGYDGIRIVSPRVFLDLLVA